MLSDCDDTVACGNCGFEVRLPGAQCDCAIRARTRVTLQWETRAGGRALLLCTSGRREYEMYWSAPLPPGGASAIRGECAGPSEELAAALAHVFWALAPSDAPSLFADVQTAWHSRMLGLVRARLTILANEEARAAR
jgi:hypothetical protein